jgi:hypothetical protein
MLTGAADRAQHAAEGAGRDPYQVPADTLPFTDRCRLPTQVTDS